MEFLIIKSQDCYIRIKNGHYIRCNIDKASFFPPHKLDKVKQHVRQMQGEHLPEVKIHRLVIQEEALTD